MFGLLVWAYGRAKVGGPGEVTRLKAFMNWYLIDRSLVCGLLVSTIGHY